MFFAVILIILILVIFKKPKDEFIKEPKTEIIFCLLWFLLYSALAVISCMFEVDIINEISNWLFLVLIPLLVINRVRNCKRMANTLKALGLKRMDKKTVFRILLTCILYTGIVVFVFSLSDEASDINVLANVPKMMARFPLYFCLMFFTAAFTEEFFFRGILQRCLANSLKRPCTGILLASILFGLYHFPFAFYLWENTAGSIINSLKDIMINQAFSGYALGLIYDRSNKNLWSSIILHACSNAVIMSLSVMFPS